MKNEVITDCYPTLSNYLHESELTSQGISCFRKVIYDFYAQHGRVLAWRQTTDPYHIVVSEIMLQQTQVERVKYKFNAFIERFPDFTTLAAAPRSQVIEAWQGLGYNRRALALHLAAQRVIEEYQGVLPDDPTILATFKGIGCATAASICAFAFNRPTPFIETNIRAVYLHTFFYQQMGVPDKQLMPLVACTLDTQNPRHWYYALMDYGVALKKAFNNPARQSAHYGKQSRFEGSERQVRGLILKALSTYGALTLQGLSEHTNRESERVERNVNNLCREGFVRLEKELFKLA